MNDGTQGFRLPLNLDFKEEDMTTVFPSLEQARDLLARAVLDQRGEVPEFDPMSIHPWLAMSLMQKAIRRGHEELALRASATLLQISPERFWRRICVTAFEDIGVADVETVAIVTAALKGKRWRSGLGGEWPVAGCLVQRMARTIKCRAADDLAVVCQWHPSLERARLKFADKSPVDLLNTEMMTGKRLIKALAVWYAMGTDRCRSPVLPERKGDQHAVWDHLTNSDIPASAVEVAREGFRKSNSILCPFVLLILPNAGQVTQETEPDVLPEEEMIGDVPCCSLDVHVREGNQAIGRFMRTDCQTIRWLVRHIPRHERFRVLGSMLFRVESGLVDRRLHWEIGASLRHMADLETGGIGASEMREGIRLLQIDLSKLNSKRRQVLETAPKTPTFPAPAPIP